MSSSSNLNSSLFLTNFCNNYGKSLLSCKTLDPNFTESLNFFVINQKPDIQSSPAPNPTNESQYDYDGALIYICVVLLSYAFCVICMIKVQTKTSDLDYFDENGDSESEKAHNLLKRIRNDSVRKEALEELIKPGFRDRMWNIYTDTPNCYKIRKSESKKIHGIDRKLKSYYSAENGNSKLNDFVQNDRQMPNKEHIFSLLKDLNKFENSSYNNTTHNTINSSMTVDNSFTTNSVESSRANRRTSLLNMNFEAPKTPNRFHVEKIKEF